MKKNFLFLVIGAMSYTSFGQIIPEAFERTETVAIGTETFLLCASTGETTAGELCGCGGGSGCIGISCETFATGNCPRDPQTLTLNIPADVDVSISINETGICGVGLEAGDKFFIQGVEVGNGDSTFPYEDCFFTEGGETGVLTIGVDTNRPDECITIVITAVANGGAGGDGTPGCVAPLPVELISFSAKEIKSNVISLGWLTASEINNDYFMIQHSVDGREYTSIEKINGAGTSELERRYSYEHVSPASGDNYYRLKQVDFDGKYEFSNALVVNIRKDAPVTVFPSLAYNKVTLDLGEVSKGETLIEVYDVMGQKVVSQVLEANESRTELNIANLAKGHYFIQLQTGNEAYTERFVKIN